MRARAREADPIAVGLDLGTTKIAAVIAELEAEGECKVIGVGCSASEGLRRGVIIDVERTVQAVRRAVEAAELMAGVQVNGVYAGLAGEHIDSCNSRGVVAVSGPGGEISPQDRERVIEAARTVLVGGGRQVLHVLPQEYFVDGQGGIRDPVGIAGVRLEADVHLVTGAATSIQNICNTIQRAGLQVHRVVLEPLASSYAVLDEDEREMGVCLLDIGGGTTDVALFSLGSVHHTAVIGLGGQNVTNDVAVGLRTSWSQAEQVKRQHGSALPDLVGKDEVIEVPGVAGRQPHPVPRRRLAAIIESRMEEILGMVRDDLRRAGFSRAPGAGVVLTGGGALLEGVVELAERVFDLPVRLGTPRVTRGMADRVSSPVFATAVGLVLYGREETSDEFGPEERPANRPSGGRHWWQGMIDWIQTFF
ncbi:MAG: cell division protein FtsA [Candidatus Latescibacterota bacterium]